MWWMSVLSGLAEVLTFTAQCILIIPKWISRFTGCKLSIDKLQPVNIAEMILYKEYLLDNDILDQSLTLVFMKFSNTNFKYFFFVYSRFQCDQLFISLSLPRVTSYNMN